MNVKFANCYVPIWKLRAGVVVEYDAGNDFSFHMHVMELSSWAEPNSGILFIKILGAGLKTTVRSDNLTWLEPH